MINISDLTTAVYNSIVAANITGLTVERGERINFDPGRCPWAGVYPDALQTEPYTIGAGSSRWISRGQIQVVLQTSSFQDDGQQASDDLESLINSVCDAISADLNPVAGYRILGFNREYRYVVFDDDGNGTIFMPQSIIRVGFEARSA